MEGPREDGCICHLAGLGHYDYVSCKVHPPEVTEMTEAERQYLRSLRPGS